LPYALGRLHKDHYEAYLAHMATGRTITETAKDLGIMRRETFDAYCRENPDFRAKVREVLEHQTPNVQVRAQSSGRTFKEVIIFMREIQELSWSEIARFFDVSESSARNIYHRMNKKGELDTYRFMD
jgi:uncharacterized protein with von Willebrand factor type A (vWA) domain